MSIEMEYGMILRAGDPERIEASRATREKKIILLWLIHQIDYRGPIGEQAGEVLDRIVPDRDMMNAFFQIVGFCMAKPDLKSFVDLFCEMRVGVLD